MSGITKLKFLKGQTVFIQNTAIIIITFNEVKINYLLKNKNKSINATEK